MTDARNRPVGNMGRILVVEDDDAIAELLTFHLTRAGYAVEQTGDGEEAVLRARETLPDLVILDWMIEGISGLEVCRQLRHLSDTASIPVIMLTTSASEQDIYKSYAQHANCFITKPVEVSQFLNVITTIEDFWINIVKLPPEEPPHATR